MDLEITGQSIKIIFCDDLVSGSVGEYTANFKFDDSWDGYELIAVFEGFTVYQRESREMNIVNGSCTVPWETLLPNGCLQVGVYGIKDGLRRPTIYTDRHIVLRGTEGAKIGAEYTPGVVEQFVAQTAENRKAAEEAATRADNAAIRQPYPSAETGTWWVWDAGAGAYRDTGISYGGSGGTNDHSKLTNRNADDQHPMSAITGLKKALESKQPAGAYLTKETDPTVPDWAKAPEKPSYTATEVGALPDTTHIPSTADDVNAEPAGAVSQHNVSDAAHNDIRMLIQGLSERLSTVADSDDTTLDQLSEIVAYIKSNKSLIDAITTSKVNVDDIVNDLTTNVANKPLSAAQGVALKTLIDAISIPDKLPNPKALTFTGAATGTYDGSAPLEVKIPTVDDVLAALPAWEGGSY